MSDVISLDYDVAGDDFTSAGHASSNVKSILKKIGLAPQTIRRVAIAMYEGEINMFIHGGGGHIHVEIDTDQVLMCLRDEGPGIADIEQAMQEGFSTASESVRNLGFGAGMGLPNMKKYSDTMEIVSAIGQGTTVTMTVKV